MNCRTIAESASALMPEVDDWIFEAIMLRAEYAAKAIEYYGDVWGYPPSDNVAEAVIWASLIDHADGRLERVCGKA